MCCSLCARVSRRLFCLRDWRVLLLVLLPGNWLVWFYVIIIVPDEDLSCLRLTEMMEPEEVKWQGKGD